MVRFIGRAVCFKRVVEDFWDVHSSCVTVEERIVGSNMDGLSRFTDNSFAVLIYLS